jgi:1-acyl-sn-glycerol-3-phosphate acyltransferase
LQRLVVRGTSGLLRLAFRVLGGCAVSGVEHVPRRGPAILAPNHVSWADPALVRLAIDRPCWFMANDFIFNYPVVGRLFPLYGAFPVRRGQLDRDALRRAGAHLTDGDLLCVFPEGATSMDKKLLPLEGGVALLALRAGGVPIVPAAITGTDRVMPRTPPHGLRYARGGVTLRFGPPISTADLPPDLPRREQVDLLTERLRQSLVDLLPPEYVE